MRVPFGKLGTLFRGVVSPPGVTGILLCLFVVLPVRIGQADPAVFVPTATAPDVPARTAPPAVGAGHLPPSWDLDGTYLWLGPVGAAGHLAGQWDSAFGVDASVVRVREHERLGAIGGSFGAARWTSHDGGRLWLDLLVGTPIAGHMVGVSAGPLVELNATHHAQVGGAVGVWGFAWITPYAKVGTAGDLGAFVELGIHVALPVIRARH